MKWFCKVNSHILFMRIELCIILILLLHQFNYIHTSNINAKYVWHSKQLDYIPIVGCLSSIHCQGSIYPLSQEFLTLVGGPGQPLPSIAPLWNLIMPCGVAPGPFNGRRSCCLKRWNAATSNQRLGWKGSPNIWGVP